MLKDETKHGLQRQSEHHIQIAHDTDFRIIAQGLKITMINRVLRARVEMVDNMIE